METQKTFKIVTNGFTGASISWWKKFGVGCTVVHQMMAEHAGVANRPYNLHGVYEVTIKVMDKESSFIFLKDVGIEGTSEVYNILRHRRSGIEYDYITPECDVDHWLDTLPDRTYLNATIKKITHEVPCAHHNQDNV